MQISYTLDWILRICVFIEWNEAITKQSGSSETNGHIQERIRGELSLHYPVTLSSDTMKQAWKQGSLWTPTPMVLD